MSILTQTRHEGTKPAGSAASYRGLLLVSCAVCFGCYAGSYMRIPVLPLFARSLGAGNFEVGMITSSFMLVAGILCIPLGIMSDRLGRKRLIVAGLLLSSVTSFLLGLSRSPWQIIVIYLFSGAGIAAFAPTMMSFVTDFTPKTHLGRSYGWYTMALYGGMSLGPAAGGLAAQFLSFEWVFSISGAFNLLMTGMVIIFLPRHLSRDCRDPSIRGSRAIINELIGNRSFQACMLVTLGSCFGLGVFVSFLPLHASEQGIDIGHIGLIFGTQALVNALCRIPFGYLSDRVAARWKLVLVGILAFSASIALIGSASSLPWFLAGAFGMGIGMGIAFTAVGALIAEVVPVDSRGLAMGGYNTCIYMGMMLSGIVMGAITDELGFRAGFILSAIICMVCLLAFFILFRTASRRIEVGVS